MEPAAFRTPDGTPVTAVTADEMREVDRVAVDDVGIGLLQMMENAGRGLAWHVRDVANESSVREADSGPVLVVAGGGGNGGGGLACARHLHNRDVPVRVVLDRPPEDLSGGTAHQWRILDAMSVPVATSPEAVAGAAGSAPVVDALVGYGLSGEVRGGARDLVRAVNGTDRPVVSLDVPSGVDATTGATRGVAVDPDRVVTLALPKTGLSADPSLFLLDIAIPATVYQRAGIDYANPFDADWVALEG